MERTTPSDRALAAAGRELGLPTLDDVRRDGELAWEPWPAPMPGARARADDLRASLKRIGDTDGRGRRRVVLVTVEDDGGWALWRRDDADRWGDGRAPRDILRDRLARAGRYLAAPAVPLPPLLRAYFVFVRAWDSVNAAKRLVDLLARWLGPRAAFEVSPSLGLLFQEAPPVGLAERLEQAATLVDQDVAALASGEPRTRGFSNAAFGWLTSSPFRHLEDGDRVDPSLAEAFSEGRAWLSEAGVTEEAARPAHATRLRRALRHVPTLDAAAVDPPQRQRDAFALGVCVEALRAPVDEGYAASVAGWLGGRGGEMLPMRVAELRAVPGGEARREDALVLAAGAVALTLGCRGGAEPRGLAPSLLLCEVVSRGGRAPVPIDPSGAFTAYDAALVAVTDAQVFPPGTRLWWRVGGALRGRLVAWVAEGRSTKATPFRPGRTNRSGESPGDQHEAICRDWVMRIARRLDGEPPESLEDLHAWLCAGHAADPIPAGNDGRRRHDRESNFTTLAAQLAAPDALAWAVVAWLALGRARVGPWSDDEPT